MRTRSEMIKEIERRGITIEDHLKILREELIKVQKNYDDVDKNEMFDDIREYCQVFIDGVSNAIKTLENDEDE